MTITRRTPDYCVEVGYAVDSPGYARSLTTRLLSARPITIKKDILLRTLKVSDTHVVVADPEGWFVVGGANSIVVDSAGRPDWYERKCRIRLLDNRTGDQVFDYVGFLIGLKAERGRATLRIASRFQRLLNRPYLANDGGKIVDKDGNAGTVASPPAGANNSYLSDVTPSELYGCEVETWTFTFDTATTYTVQGSQTGDDGSGSIAVNFTSDSQKITVAAADWVNDAGNLFEAEDRCSIKTVYRFSAATTVLAFYEALTDSHAADLDAADVHPSVLSFVGSVVDQPLSNGLVIDDSMSVLSSLQMISLHMLSVAIEYTDARIGMYAYTPEVGVPSEILCKGTDLKNAAIDSIPIYNEFPYNYDYSETDESYGARLTYPDNDDDNPSLKKYHVKERPRITLNLKGFNEANESWIRSLAAQNYERWAWPRPTYALSLKVPRMNIEMDELFRVESSNPTVDVIAVEPAEIRRKISPNFAVEGVFFDASFYFNNPAICGYAFLNRGHRMDDCWVVF